VYLVAKDLLVARELQGVWVVKVVLAGRAVKALLADRGRQEVRVLKVQ
jgi:hypothetical protein